MFVIGGIELNSFEMFCAAGICILDKSWPQWMTDSAETYYNETIYIYTLSTESTVYTTDIRHSD